MSRCRGIDTVAWYLINLPYENYHDAVGKLVPKYQLHSDKIDIAV